MCIRMIKIFQKYDAAVKDLERIIIEETTAIHERIMISNDIWFGVVWKTYTDDIIKDYKWTNARDYIKWIKQLGYKEVSELDSIGIGLNDKEYKKYKNIEQQIEAQQLIKITFADKDYIATRINGSVEDIVKHYESNNRTSKNKVTKIDFLESPVLQNASGYTYLFLDEKTAI